MRKKILLICYLYYPSTLVGARRAFNFKKCLETENISVTVLTVKKNKYPEIDPSLESVIAEKNVYVTNCLGPIKVLPKKASESYALGFFRRVSYLLYSILSKFMFPDEYLGWTPFALYKAIALIRKEKFNFILATGLPWTDFLIADILNHFTGIPFILDYRDPWTAWRDYPFKTGFLRMLSEWYEKKLVKRASLIFVTTNLIKDMFLQKYGPAIVDKIFVVSNGYNLDIYNKLLQSLDKKKYYDKFKMIHTGNFYGGRTIASFLSAIGQLKSRNIISMDNFEFITYGSLLRDDKRLIHKFELENLVIEKDYISYETSLNELSSSVMNFLVVGSEHAAMVPAKLYDYFMCGRPIFAIGPVGSVAQQLIERHNFGIYVSMIDQESIARTMEVAINRFKRGEMNERLSAPVELSIENQMKFASGFINAHRN